jgi:hypothetical protein
MELVNVTGLLITDVCVSFYFCLALLSLVVLESLFNTEFCSSFYM